MHACVLIGYLSAEKLNESVFSKNSVRARLQRLFHQSMRIILEPLIEAGLEGVEMVGGNGEVRRVHPILACYSIDYPEQCLVSCTKSTTCPKCRCPNEKLSELKLHEPRTKEWTLGIIEEALRKEQMYFADAKRNKLKGRRKKGSMFHKTCMASDVAGGAFSPFWSDMPFFDIHLSLTPDILHQVWQGVFKYLVEWAEILLGKKALDTMLKRLPHGHNVRHFQDGWCHLSQVSGSERKEMAKVLLGCLVSSGKFPPYGIIACRSLLDFIYIAQYTTHDETTLSYLSDALKAFHNTQHFFVDTKIREDLNITKFHALLHYPDSIRLFGTTDNYNTELFERLHIDFSKKGWRASNRRNAFPQMIKWLGRKEKMQAFQKYLERRVQEYRDHKKSEGSHSETETETDVEQSPTQITVGHKATELEVRFHSGASNYTIAKHPNDKKRTMARIAKEHNAPFLEEAMVLFLNTYLQKPETTKRALKYHTNPIKTVDVFYQFKIYTPSDDPDIIYQNRESVVDSGYCDSVKANRETKQYDTVVVMWNGDAESTGLGGTRIGRVKVIFRLPTEINGFAVPARWPTQPLAYVEWYSPLQKTLPQSNKHLMYKLKKGKPGDRGIIIPITEIRQSCMLFPLFSEYKEEEIESWKAKTVLDSCNTFLVNNWSSKHCYNTIW